MSFLNKIDKLLNLLERIAIALEMQVGISNFPDDIPKENNKSKLQIFTPSNSIEEDNSSEKFDKEIKEKGIGFFFEEDAISQETLDSM